MGTDLVFAPSRVTPRSTRRNQRRTPGRPDIPAARAPQPALVLGACGRFVGARGSEFSFSLSRAAHRDAKAWCFGLSERRANPVSKDTYMARLFTLGYGIGAYALFLFTILYAIGFVGNVFVPKSIDTGTPASIVEAVSLDLLWLGLFAAQHSVMARPGFKRWWTRFVPKSIERSTFVLFASLALLLLYWQWRPMPQSIWSVEGAAGTGLQVVSWIGWALVFASTFMIHHF